MERNHKVKVDYGMNDYYKFYCNKYDKDIDRKKYSKIIVDFNKEIQKAIILDSFIYSMPYINFQLLLMKEKRKPTIKDGKLLNNIPVDFKSTKKLWERDPEAKKKKLLVRYNNSHTSHFVFRIYFKKFASKVKGKSAFKFQTNRDFKRLVNKYIKNPNVSVDAYLLYKNQYHV